MNKLPQKTEKSNYFESWFFEKFGEPLNGSDPGSAPAAERPAVNRSTARAYARIINRELSGPFRPKKKTKAEKRADRKQREYQRRLTFIRDLSRQRAKLEKNLLARGLGPELSRGATVIPTTVWLMAAHVVSDRTGAAGRHYLSQVKNLPAAACIRRAAGLSGRGWVSLRARRIVALGLFLNGLARYTRRSGSAWNGCVMGVPREALRAAIADCHARPGKERPSINAIAGTHRRAARSDKGEVGYLRALEAAGLLYSQQLPPWAATVRPYERAGSWTINRYWIVAGNCYQPFDDREKNRLLTLAAEELAARAADRGHPATAPAAEPAAQPAAERPERPEHPPG
jgi:hypothetical protein